MKKPCESCKSLTDREDLKRCQSDRCRLKGECHCDSCIEQHGESLAAPFICNRCHPEKQKKKRVKAPVKPKRPPVDKSGWCHRLISLREAIGVNQSEMAKALGSSRRAYQNWEYGEKKMLNISKVNCWHLAKALAPKLAKQWPEGRHAKALIKKGKS